MLALNMGCLAEMFHKQYVEGKVKGCSIGSYADTEWGTPDLDKLYGQLATKQHMDEIWRPIIWDSKAITKLSGI